MEVSTIEEIGESRWDAYVDSCEQASVYHLSGWKGVLSRVFNCQCHYLAAISEAGDVSGVLPLVHFKNRLFGNFLVSMPYFNHGGLLSNDAEAEEALLDHVIHLAQELEVSHIELREFHGRHGNWQYKDEKVLMLLDLPSNPDVLWKSIGSKRRSQVKRPEREGASVSTGGLELLNDFYSVFSRNMRDLGTPVYARALFAEILENFPSDTFVVVIYLNAVPVAAAFLVGHRKTVEIPWASSLREYNRLGTNMKLYWEVLKFSISQGYEIFDFGRSTVDGPTYKFKKQWGSQPKQCFWNYWLAEGNELPQLNPNNPKYKMAIEGWKRLPLFVANSLGPHIVKHLP